jgi:hypothetical protein
MSAAAQLNCYCIQHCLRIQYASRFKKEHAMPSSYEQEPIVELKYWSVYEVPLYGADAPWTRHFVGYAEEMALPHVSSAIIMFDRELGVGASASHRVFQLVGQSGLHQEAAQHWARWKSLNGVQLDRDITPGFFKTKSARQSAVA